MQQGLHGFAGPAISHGAFLRTHRRLCSPSWAVRSCGYELAQRILLEVNSLRQFGAVLLLLVSFVAPAMACMAPDAEMTVEERACCRMMKNDCGHMEMPASHDCCKKTPGTVKDSALRSNSITFHPLVAVAACVPLFDLFPPHDAANGWIQRPEHSPPKPPPSIISALRV